MANMVIGAALAANPLFSLQVSGCPTKSNTSRNMIVSGHFQVALTALNRVMDDESKYVTLPLNGILGSYCPHVLSRWQTKRFCARAFVRTSAI